MRSKPTISIKNNVILLAAITAVAMSAAAVDASTNLAFTAASPSPLAWETGSNWSGGAAPTPSYIATDGLASSEVTISTAVNPIDGVYWANVANSNATLDIGNGGNLTTNGTSSVSFGRAQPSTGTLNVTGTGTLVVGTNSTIVWGGTISPGALVLGDDTGATGSTHGVLNFSGTGVNPGDAGTISVGNSLSLGDASKGQLAYGTVTHTSGLLTVGQGVYVGHDGVGSYTISGGSLVQSGTDRTQGQAIVIGNAGPTGTASTQNTVGSTGTFTQTGGSVVANGGVSIANLTGSTGTYTISGGSLNDSGILSVAATGQVAVYGGYSNTNGGISPIAGTTNSSSTGAFIVSGHTATSITATSLDADSATSTLGFQIGDSTGTTLINLSGVATLSALTKIDIDSLSGYTPSASAVFELIRAGSFSTSVLPTLVADGDAFDNATLSIRSNGNGTQSLIASFAAVPEPASAAVFFVGAIVGMGRKRNRGQVSA